MGRGGSNFERKFSKELSLWYTHGESDAIFWRSTTSGARATTRAKQGKTTSGQYGDIAATDPRGSAFIKAIIIELKKGYNDQTPMNLLDSQTVKYEEWVTKTVNSAALAGTAAWMIIHQRKQRLPIMWMPHDLCTYLEQEAGLTFTNSITFSVLAAGEFHFVTGVPLSCLWEMDPARTLKALELYSRVTAKMEKLGLP